MPSAFGFGCPVPSSGTGASTFRRTNGHDPPYCQRRPAPILPAMGSLYDADILLWSEQQADLLRRLSRGERVNDAVDWANLIEEVGDVGRSEFNSVVGLLRVGLTHLLLA